MDVSASAENSRRRKSNDEPEDKLSNLPENILQYILSFVPTKYVVACSILSKRWRYLWMSVHNLDFSDRLVYSASLSKRYVRRKKGFIKFVNRVLHLNSVSSIDKFSLTWFDYDEAHFREWMSVAVRRKVQELILFLYVDVSSYVFPFCLLLFESLKILKFESADCLNRVSFKISSSIYISNLKVLHLNSVTFSCEKFTQEVSLTFLILEELILEDFRWLEIKSVNISTPALQVLTINERWGTDIELPDCEIKILANNIISLDLSCIHLYKYSICNLSHLNVASIHVIGDDDAVRRLGTVLRQISNVKDLQLSADCTETLSHPDISGHLFPFSYLTRLSLVGRGRSSLVSGRKLVEFLSCVPNIEALHFPGGLDSFTFKGRGRLIGQTPQCFLSQLKLLDLGIFYGKDDEFWFVKFLLKSASVDKLTIKVRSFGYLAGWRHEDRKEKIIKQLQMLASDPKCVGEFSSEECVGVSRW